MTNQIQIATLKTDVANTTDDKLNLQSILNFANSTPTLDYMRLDGGRLIINSLFDDVLSLTLTGKCPTCRATEGTKRGIAELLSSRFGVEVEFSPSAVPAPGQQPRPQ